MRAVVQHPAGHDPPLAPTSVGKICGKVVIAFTRNRTLGIRNGIAFEATYPRPTRSRAYASPVALPRPAQGSLPARAGSPLAGRVSHPLDDIRNFMESSHPPIPFDQQSLVALILLAHDRRRVVHFNVTTNPTAQWTGQQVVEAFPWDTAPRFLVRDRDGVYGADFRRRVRSMGIEEVVIAARSPWQSPYVERMIGSVRRECLDNVVVLSERHLRRILKDYFSHSHRWRCHQSLEMDCPEPRAVHLPEVGQVAPIREAGGLCRHYERAAA